MGALDNTYFDFCDIKRNTTTKERGITKNTLVNVHENIRCALSQSTTSFRETTKGDLAEQKISYKLFLNPAYQVKQGDSVEVRANGMVVIATVDAYFRYPDHQEILLQVERYV
jgi:hypothetical protein